MRAVLFLASALIGATALAAQESNRFPGRIEAVQKADVSNAIASTITGIHFVPGQRVQEGDLLFTLDAEEFELKLASERANVLRAESTLQSAQSDFERITQLQQRGSATGVQVLKAEVARAFADSVRAETQAKMRAALVDLERTRILAPISGIINAPTVSQGTYVKKGHKPLAHIVALDPVRIAYEVPYVERIDELELENLKFPESLLDRVELRLVITEDWEFPGSTKPTHVSGNVDPETGNLTIWAEIANPLGQLRPGMKVTVVSRVPEAR